VARCILAEFSNLGLDDKALYLSLFIRRLGEAGGDEGPVGVPRPAGSRAELGENGRRVLPRAGDGPQKRTVAGPGIAVERPEIGDDLGPEGV